MRLSIFIIFTSIIAGFFYANGKKNDSSTYDQIKRKADYIFLESQSRYQTDDAGDYFNMMRLASDLDPEENIYNNELGYLYLLLSDRDGNLDSLLFTRALNMLKKGYENNPDDLFSAMRYATICQRLGMSKESLEVWQHLTDKYPTRPEISFNYADLLFQQGDTASIRHAIEIYKNLERTQGNNLGITSQKVRAYLALHDTIKALSEISRLIEASPKSSQNQIFSGDVFMAIGKQDSALYHYNRAILLDSTNGLAYHKLAEYYQLKGDSIGYDREIFNALSQSNLEVPDKIELLRGYVQNLFNDSIQRPRIEKLFEVITTQHPHEAEIRDLYSSYLAVIGDYENSAEQTALYLDLNPSEITIWNRLISLYFTLQEYDKALDACIQASHFFPDNITIQLMTSSAYLNTDKPDSAIVILNKALLNTEPSNIETLSDIETSLGDAYYKIDEKDSAFVHYDKALELNPRNILAMNNCAYFLACEGRELNRAENLSYMVIREEPDNPTYLDTYAWVLFKQKQFEKAKEYIDMTLDLESEASAELLEHAGDIYFMNLLPDEALNFWKDALNLDPNNSILQKKIKEKRYLTE